MVQAAMSMPQASAAKRTSGQPSSDMPMSPFSAVQGPLTRDSEPGEWQAIAACRTELDSPLKSPRGGALDPCIS